jgi:hypothetical protein
MKAFDINTGQTITKCKWKGDLDVHLRESEKIGNTLSQNEENKKIRMEIMNYKAHIY